MRSKPKAGYNISQSFFDFETNSDKLRFGMEDNKLFVEINEVKTFITDANGQIIAVVSSDEINVAVLNSSTLSAPANTPVNAVASAGKITSSGALVAASHAESVLTSDATNNTEDETVTIGTTVYRWRDTLAQAYDVKIGASAAISLDNLKAAINASGTPGVEYFADTLVHPDIIATDNADTTQKIVARVPGLTANSIVTTESGTHTSWADTTLGGGTGASNPGVTDAASTVTIGSQIYMFVVELSETSGATAIVNQVLYGGSEAVALDNLKLAINNGLTEGTEYSTGTIENADVIAGTNTDTTQVVTAKIAGVISDTIAITTTCANTAWDDVTLGTEVAGVDGTVGVLNEIAIDSSYFYFCIAVNTIADNNWRRISLGSAY